MMKKLSLVLLFILPCYLLSSQNLKPYILGFESNEEISLAKSKVVSNMEKNGLTILGQYLPADDVNRWIIVFTSNDLIGAVQKIGGLSGFAGSLRLAITSENGKTLISYTNPVYWGNAYFRDDFPSVSSNYAALTSQLEKAMRESGEFIGRPFGSKEGLSVKDLRKYQYMMGMPYFDDTEELEDFGSYKDAVAKIESSIKKGIPHVKMVYRLAIPGKELCLYGFALSGEDGEKTFLPVIDISNPKHTAFLPYEILVKGNEVHMLHGRFRIALSFPDLTMGTFTKIMSTPGNIEDLLEQLVE